MAEIKVVADKSPPTKRPGEKSKVSYPYFNLKQSIEVANLVHTKGGGVCTRDQIASFLGYSTIKSGTFLTRISAAKMFGFIDIKKDRISIKEKAKKIIAPIMPEDADKAKIEAFLTVPLFNMVYNRFKGSTLPPDAGLKNLFENEYFIVKDRITPALRVLKESAEQAGFFSTGGRNKLIQPVLNNFAAEIEAQKKPKKEDGAPPQVSPQKPGDGGDEPPTGIHTAIIGLLRELPKAGTVWQKTKKDRFLKAFESTLDFIYPESSEEDTK